MGDPRKITEKQLQEEVRKMALIHGWEYYHPWISIHSTSGYPDCTLVHVQKRRMIWAELKADGKEPTSKQREWLDNLQNFAGAWSFSGVSTKSSAIKMEIGVYVWKPADIDRIWEILSRQ